MYTILVFCGGSPVPSATHRIAQSAEVLTSIPEIMRANPGCERLEVLLAGTRLFTVDCEGNTTAG